MHVIVVGAGQVGSNIASSLASEHDVVVVDLDGDRVESLTYSHDVLAIQGDGTDLETLEEAGIFEADMVIASTDRDETNIVVCGTGKAVGDPFTIARVKQTQLLRTWEQSERVFGVDFMVCTNLLTAEAIVRIASLPGARDVDTFADGLVHMAEFEVDPESPIAGDTVSQADRFEPLTFAAIIRDDDVVIPRGETTIDAGDEVVVIGSVESVRDFATALTPAPTLEDASEVVVVGGSEIGYQTARLLEREGFSPRLVERDAERARKLAERLPNTLVLESDATDIDFLVREHVDESDIVVAALDSDEKNLLVSLLARRIGVDLTLSIVEYGEYVDLFETVGVDVAINPRLVTAEEITRFTREEQTENVHIVESDRAEVLEIEVDRDSLLFGNRIQDVTENLPEGVVIGAITRSGELISPRGETVVELGDHVVVFVDTAVVDEVESAL
ncbi:Trk system potassium transporter TrkA [Natribaculum luteum]|uniref:Trk system potassium transporter TrkA n=1 Tax=Natribaculum luteum TaxID=1586232 RepID=A0ABD5NZT9_9EURY|nr:Trk system potassium transporter TrkA [Natribaculum luteum]